MVICINKSLFIQSNDSSFLESVCKRPNQYCFFKDIVSVLLTAAVAAVPVSAFTYATPFISKTDFPCSLNLYADSPNYVTVELGPKSSISGTYTCKITAQCTYVDSSGNDQNNTQTASSTNGSAYKKISVMGSAPMYKKIVSTNYVEYNGDKGVKTLSY